MEYDFQPAIDAREQLRRWDAGDTIWTIEMGGIGPGYEQAIQLLAIEIVRDEIDKPIPPAPPSEWGNETVSRLERMKTCGGFSGAQVGAAKFLSWKWFVVGPAALCAEFSGTNGDRKIQASKRWPRVG